MIFLLVLHIIFVHMSDCVLITVRRARNYDTIVWDGDCSRLKANYAGFAEERTCVCRKKIKVNEIESELTGTLYQTTGAFPICLYDYREIGANMLVNSYSQQIYIISGYQGTMSFRLRSNARSWFTKNQVISIKDILLYNFNINEPFIKIPSNNFLVTNISVGSGYYFHLQVNGIALRKYKGNLMQIIFEMDDRSYGTKETFGFMVIKFAGERKCLFDIHDFLDYASYGPDASRYVAICYLLKLLWQRSFCKKNCQLFIPFIAAEDDLDLQPEYPTKTLQKGLPKDASWKIGNIVLGTISGIFAVVIVILYVKQRRTKSRYKKVKKESKKNEETIVATERRNEPYITATERRHEPYTQLRVNNSKNQPKPNDTQYDNLREDKMHSTNLQSDLHIIQGNYQNTNYVYDEILE